MSPWPFRPLTPQPKKPFSFFSYRYARLRVHKTWCRYKQYQPYKEFQGKVDVIADNPKVGRFNDISHPNVPLPIEHQIPIVMAGLYGEINNIPLTHVSTYETGLIRFIENILPPLFYTYVLIAPYALEFPLAPQSNSVEDLCGENEYNFIAAIVHMYEVLFSWYNPNLELLELLPAALNTFSTTAVLTAFGDINIREVVVDEHKPIAKDISSLFEHNLKQ